MDLVLMATASMGPVTKVATAPCDSDVGVVVEGLPPGTYTIQVATNVIDGQWFESVNQDVVLATCCPLTVPVDLYCMTDGSLDDAGEGG